MNNLFVISHGDDEAHDEILNGCNVIHVPREFSVNFDASRFEGISHFASMLLKFYNCVIVCDTDELICADPELNIPLNNYVETLEAGKVYAPIGFRLLPPASNDESDWSKPILTQTNLVLPDGRYSKPSILKCDAKIGPGGHLLDGMEFKIANDIFMFHLKFLPNNESISYHNEIQKSLKHDPGRQITTKRQEISKLWLFGPKGNNAFVNEMQSAPEIDSVKGLARSRRPVNARYIYSGTKSYVRQVREMKFHLPERFNDLL